MRSTWVRRSWTTTTSNGSPITWPWNWQSPARDGPPPAFAELGLVNKLTEPGQALAGALELAQDVLAAGPLAVRASNQIVQHAYDWTEPDAWKNQMEYAAPVMASEDLQEGLRAFAEKRPAVWKGR